MLFWNCRLDTALEEDRDSAIKIDDELGSEVTGDIYVVLIRIMMAFFEA